MPNNRYQEIDKEQLRRLHEGLDILESVNRQGMRDLDLYIYGLTQSESIADAAREAIADEADIEESDVQLTEVAVAIPLSSDTIHYLTGGGLRLRREDFAYMGQGGEGVRTSTFTFSHYKPAVAVTDFSVMVVGSSDSWLDDFLKQYGNKQSVQIKENVHRTEEATQPGMPAAAVPPAAPTTPEIPKKTSLTGGLKLAEALEEFLGS